MPSADANGQTLYYEVHGEGEPLLCVMGLAADTLTWALNVPDFAQRHRTIVFDNRDVGQSSMADGPYDLIDMAHDALALADELELDSFHLLGVSMGGAISQEMALTAPERVHSLTLAVTYASGGSYSRELARVWAARRQAISWEQHVDELMLLCFSEALYENADFIGYIRQMMLANPHPQRPDAFARQLDAASRHDSRDRLASLTMPVHVIGAEHDILVPVWKAAELAALIPGAKYSLMEGAAHGVQTERAQEFNQLVLDFIAEQTAVAAD